MARVLVLSFFGDEGLDEDGDEEEMATQVMVRGDSEEVQQK